ncbi:MAG: S9 family peptidase [Pyrobaculum sp.]
MEWLVRRALSIRSATSPSFGPGGVVYYLSDVTGEFQLWKFDGFRHDVVVPWGGRVGDYVVSNDGALAVAVDSGGDEQWRIYIVEGDVVEVSTEGVNLLGAWSPDSTQLAFTSTRDDSQNFYLYIYDRRDRSLKKVAELPGLNIVEEWGEAGVLITHYESNLESSIYLYRGGQLIELTKRSDGALSRSPIFINGGRLLFLTNLDWDYVGVASMDLSTGQWRYIVQLDRDVELLDRWGSYITFAVNEGGQSGLYYMHIPSGLTHKISTPAGVVTSLQFRNNSILFSLSSINRGHEVYIYQGGAVRQITHSPRFGFPLEKIPEPQSIYYTSHDGRKIPANIYRPVGEPEGTVVYLHGGPESQDRPEFKPLVAAMLASGLLVAAPNFRGSSGYGKTYLRLDDREKRWDAIRDVVHFVDWLVENRLAERGEICAIGGSYGGYMVLMALATAPGVWKCGVEIAGIYNLVTFLERTAPWRRKYREAEYGSLERDRQLLEELSPSSHIEKITASLLVIHGANDVRVPLYEAEQLVKRLRELGREVQFLVLPDEGHVITKIENRVRAYVEAVKFIRHYLKKSNL